MKSSLMKIIGFLVVASFILSACTPPAQTAAPTKATGGESPAAPTSAPEATAAPVKDTGPVEVVIVQNSDPQTLDPQKPGGQTGGNFAFNLFDGLTIQTQDMKEVKPGLATEWRLVDDLTWEFKLREGVKFHNGEDFNAEVVKYTVDRLKMPDAVRITYSFGNVSHAEVVDDYTVRIITKTPDPMIPAKVFGLHMIPPKYDAEVGEEEFGKKPIGTGPYKLVENSPNQQIVLEAFDDYWGGKPAVDRLIFKPVPEASTRVAELMAGTGDIVLNVPPEDIPTIEADSDVHIATVPGKRVPYVGLDLMPQGPAYLKDVRVRQALNYAVDVDGIIEALLSGYGDRVATIYRQDFMGYNPDLKPYPYDPEKAKELLADAGIKEGDITLKIATSAETTNKGVEVAEAIAGMLQEVGINAEADVLAEQAIRDMYIGGQEAYKIDPLWLWNWGSREPDADSALSGFLHSSGITSYLRDETLDKMIEEARSMMDEDMRIEKHKAIQQYIYENAPVIFLYVSHDIYGINNRVEWTPRRDQYVLGIE
ncbi:MAG: hypothetical protein IT308_02275, partial [Anaerolineaceae bacterium]|nr:hypothetical protein [Anaerolineaceae bacterium]